MSLLTIEERDGREAAKPPHAMFALGFRPFYLLAAAFAAASIPAWVASYFGWIAAPQLDLAWHVHEMVFGFAVAVIVGFLYTAGRNWTGLWTPRGKLLAALAGLWLAGRLAMASGVPLLATAVDVAFLPAAAWPFYRVIKRSGNKRNMILVGVLALLGIANACYHAAMLGLAPLSPLKPVYAAIVMVIVIETIIGGRVIPNFTANAVPGTRPLTDTWRDRASIVLTACAGLAWISPLPAQVAGIVALAAGAAQGARLIGWKPQVTLHNPLLWILHVSYLCIPLGLVALGLAQFDLMPQSAAVHLLGVGAIGGLIAGMITRTALGHTGRALKAGRAETFMYVLVTTAVLARFAAALTTGTPRDIALVLAAACWSIAFAAYVVTYAPYLSRARIDGREG